MKKLPLLALVISLNVVAAPNSIVAIVNDELITYDAITVKANSKAAKLAAVNHQIDTVLQMDKVTQLGIKPNPLAINNMLKRVAQQNSLSLKQLQASSAFGRVMKDIKQKLSLNALKELINSKAKLSLTQVEIDQALTDNPASENDLVKQIRIAQIAISSIDKTDSLLQSEDELIKDFLTDLANKIEQGESFSAMAKLHSQDESYKNGGESGWLVSSRLPKEFTNVIDSLALNEASKPFKVGNGWRLIKVIESREVDQHLRNIKAALMRQKENVYFKSWINKLRQDAYIEIFDHKL
ncbi:MAG: peptidylprolyl isomerase [Candidatus Thioglobus sp.]|uniref:peptidylprolyl isomerase n=1 Tax=Candidatus Thioglobus sp. TaxID=2026721 RepID=UPI00260CFD6C|nr:peptidylprolyl isomerase [Candidatus Thioglobus sp.]MDC9726289.1 peptidylprolyl isomerase [Candidatus Thioglobus sp.]